MTLFQLSYAGLWLVALILAVLVIVMGKQFAKILGAANLLKQKGTVARARKLTAGDRLRGFSGLDLRSGATRTSEEWSGAPFVVLALSPTCRACKTFVSQLLATGDIVAEAVIGLCVGSASECESAPLATVQSIPVLTVEETDVPEIAVSGVPLAIAVGADGIVTDVRHPGTVSEVAAMLAALRNDDAHAAPARTIQAHVAARPGAVPAR